MTKKSTDPKITSDPSSENLTEQFILKSGNHTRTEGGVTRKYRAGDIVPVTAKELVSFPDKFMKLSEFEEKLSTFEHQRAKEEDTFKKAMSRSAKKEDGRDSAAVQRNEDLLKMRKIGRRLVV
jgi:hypothetical protein